MIFKYVSVVGLKVFGRQKDNQQLLWKVTLTWQGLHHEARWRMSLESPQAPAGLHHARARNPLAINPFILEPFFISYNVHSFPLQLPCPSHHHLFTLVIGAESSFEPISVTSPSSKWKGFGQEALGIGIVICWPNENKGRVQDFEFQSLYHCLLPRMWRSEVSQSLWLLKGRERKVTKMNGASPKCQANARCVDIHSPSEWP